MTKKILYIMHIDWKWIKQRPHFIAEGLSNIYDINVVYFVSKRFIFGNSYDSTANEKDLNLLPVLRLPLYQNKFIYKLNKTYLKIYFKILIEKYDPDYIWITFPQLYDYIPSNTRCKIIYDCMDEATGFDFNNNFKSCILKSEKRLVKDASIVFVSSNYLFKSLGDNYKCKDKLVLIRNAFGGEIIKEAVDMQNTRDKFKIGYVGTISQWLDFDAIKVTLDNIKNIEYHFIGPIELENVKLKQDNIKFYGTVPHNEIYDYVKYFDCLIVPFKVDNKIKSADPGKIYGYINYNKPIISIYYKELDYFSEFVYFYTNWNELTCLLENMIKNGFITKYSDSKRVKFLKANSWDVRVANIAKNLIKLE